MKTATAAAYLDWQDELGRRTLTNSLDNGTWVVDVAFPGPAWREALEPIILQAVAKAMAKDPALRALITGGGE